jgi:hypothetical protein
MIAFNNETILIIRDLTPLQFGFFKVSEDAKSWSIV